MFPHNKKKYFLATSIAVALLLSFPVLALAISEWNETPVVTDSFDQVNASMSGSVVVWQDYRNKQQVPPNSGTGCPSAQNCIAADIYALDLNGGTERRLTTSFNGLDPDISGSLVVWRNWDTGRIVVYDLATETQQEASAAPTQMVSPSISGNRVVWGDYRNSINYGDIYMRDMSQPSEVYVSRGADLPAGKTDSQKDKRNPEIGGDIVVWEDMRNAFQDAQGWWHNPDIYMKNLATGVESAVCTNTSDQYNPVVAGNRVYWMDYRNNNWDVYVKDLDTGIETRLTSDNAHQSWPSASGGFVVWKDVREGDEDIYMKNMNNGVEQRVNMDPVSSPIASQKIPIVDGSRVSWMDKRANNWDIYTARDDVGPKVDAVTPSGLVATGAPAISASYSDAGTGVDATTVIVSVDGLPLTGCVASATQVDCLSSGFTEGSHKISVGLSDYSGNLSFVPETQFFVDTVRPTISIINVLVPEGTDTSMIDTDLNDPTPGSGIDLALVEVTLDGLIQNGCIVDFAHVSCNFTGLALGNHSFGITAIDLAGNAYSSISDFKVADMEPPVITSPNPVGSIAGDSVVLSAAFMDDLPSSGVDPASASMSVDGVVIAGCSSRAESLSCPLNGVADGSHQIRAVVADNAGNIGDLTWSIIVNGGPDIYDLAPAAGAVINDPVTPLAASWSDLNDGIDDASVCVYLDGVRMEPPGITLAASSFGYQPDWNSRLVDGTHTVRVVVADLKGTITDQVWSFTVTSPALVDMAIRTYWENYASYLQRMLSIDYRLTDTGTGRCLAASVATGTASGGVLPDGFPVALDGIASGDFAAYTIRYSVPAGVGRFMALNYASCTDDAGNTYWSTGRPPA